MSAFFKPKGVKTTYFSTSNPNVKNDASGWGIEISAPVSVMNSKGEPLDSLEVSANQRVILNLGFIENQRYHLFIKHNPEFFTSGQVQLETIRAPGESGDLLLHFKAERALNIGNLSWIVRLYLAD
jgi:hypothetical protein